MDKERFLSSGLLEQYALGLTTPEESGEVERYLEAYPELRQEIDSMRRAIEQYARHQSIPPPGQVKSKTLSQIEGIEEGPASRPVAAAPAGAFSWTRVLTMAAAAVFGILAFLFYRQQQAGANDYQRLSAEFAALEEDCHEQRQRAAEQENIIALLRNPQTQPVRLLGTALAPEAQVIVYWNSQDRKACLNNLSLPKPPAGKQYQIWADVDGKMIHIGLLDPDPAHLQPVEYIDRATSLNITLEPLGGSKEPTVEFLVVNGKV